MPDFCDVRIIFMLVLLVEVLSFVLAMVVPSNVETFWDYLAFMSILMQWIGLVNAAILCKARTWLNKLPTIKAVSTIFMIMMLVSLFFAFLILKLNEYLEYMDSAMLSSEFFLIRIMLISAVIYSVMLRYFYIQQQWIINIHSQSRAEIQALRARIRPHFLFNSMNTIVSLISIAPEKAEKAVEDLSDLFRASIAENENNTLADELELTRSYVDIESLRLNERLKVEWKIDESLLDTEMPALCLQPLVENAIYHGIEPLSGGGTIYIEAAQRKGSLYIIVSNPLNAHPLERHVKGNKMAQKNIRQRLQLMYGKEAEFLIEQNENYTVSMMIPLDTDL